MARARSLRGIRPRRSVRENARRVVLTRLDEFLMWRGALSDPALVSDLHDMRIAAKRLRYAVEMFDICIADPGPLLKELTRVQDELGVIHDLDVMADILRSRLERLDTAIEEEASHIMGSDMPRLDRSRAVRRLLVSSARDPHRVGLLGLLGDTIATRRERYLRFQDRYSSARLEGMAERTTAAFAEPDEDRRDRTQEQAAMQEETETAPPAAVLQG